MQTQAAQLKKRVGLAKQASSGGFGPQEGVLRFVDGQIQACNGVVDIRVECPSNLNVCLSTPILEALLKQLKGHVSLSTQTDGKVRVVCPPHTSNLAPVAVTTYQQILPQAEFQECTDEFFEALAFCHDITESSAARPHMSGVCMRGQEMLASFRGLTMAWVHLDNSPLADGGYALLPRDFTKLVVKYGKPDQIALGSTKTARTAVVYDDYKGLGRVQIGCSHINAEFVPEWRQYFPDDLEKELVELPFSDDVKSALLRMQTYEESDSEFDGCRFVLGGNMGGNATLLCDYSTQTAAARELVQLETDVEDEFSFSTWPSFLLWGLKACGNLRVMENPDLIYFSDSSKHLIVSQIGD